jgi:hypothetical protein
MKSLGKRLVVLLHLKTPQFPVIPTSLAVLQVVIYLDEIDCDICPYISFHVGLSITCIFCENKMQFFLVTVVISKSYQINLIPGGPL